MGELGERVVCQVLVGASDVDRPSRLRHLCRRLSSPTATGDDRDLLRSLEPLTEPDLALLADAIGVPSQLVSLDPVATDLPDDWIHAWRWSAVLPPAVLEGWADQIAAVVAAFGEMNAATLETPISRFTSSRPPSPFTVDELSCLSPMEASSAVAGWRPSEADRWWGNTASELGSVLQRAIESNLSSWLTDPAGIVKTLKEPVYIERYFWAIQTKATEAASRAHPILDAVRLVDARRWRPTDLGGSALVPETVWDSVLTSAVSTIGGLADAEADLHLPEDLTFAWDLTVRHARAWPTQETGDEGQRVTIEESEDVLQRAIARPYCKALETAIRLACWEHRQLGRASEWLAGVLDDAVNASGAVGAEMRSVIAARRRLVEVIAPQWMARRMEDLFDGPFGASTFMATLRWNTPTPAFLAKFPERLAKAAAELVEGSMSWLLMAYLWDLPGYTAKWIVASCGGSEAAVKSAAEEIAGLFEHDNDPDPTALARAVALWDELLGADPIKVPPKALAGAGRWAFVRGLGDDAWLRRAEQSLELTDGSTSYATDIADRCKLVIPSERGLHVVRMLQGRGEPWERWHVAEVATELLKNPAWRGLGPEFNRLRARLLELGHAAVREIPPEPRD